MRELEVLGMLLKIWWKSSYRLIHVYHTDELKSSVNLLSSKCNIFIQLRCCGVQSFRDYEEVFNNSSIPVSCCNTDNSFDSESLCTDMDVDSITNTTELIHTEVSHYCLITLYEYYYKLWMHHPHDRVVFPSWSHTSGIHLVLLLGWASLLGSYRCRLNYTISHVWHLSICYCNSFSALWRICCTL